MVRILIIGTGADSLGAALDGASSAAVQVDTARLPAAGIRQFESTPADAIILTDDRGSTTIETLAEAIRERPLGKLTPLLVVAPAGDKSDEQVQQFGLADWLDVDAAPALIVEQLEQQLDVSIATAPDGDSPAPVADETHPDGSASYFDGGVVLEPVDEPPPGHPTNRTAQNPAASQADRFDEPLEPAAIERKLKQVRHQDYYAILEVPRGAETQTVREAFAQLYQQFDPDEVPFGILQEHRRDIEEIRDALEDAFAVLADPTLREAYLEHTTTT